MNFALRVTSPNLAKAVTLAAAITCLQSEAVAGYVVDTGTPRYPYPARTTPLLGKFPEQIVGELGASFELATAQTLTAVDGWIATVAAGDLTVSLWSGPPVVDGTPLFTTTSHLEISPLHEAPAGQWETFGGLNWAVGPGTYSVTFQGSLEYMGFMNPNVPSPLPVYYVRAGSVSPPWSPLRPDLDVSFGMRVAAIPEPETYTSMLAGLGIVGVAARRRKA